MFSGKNPNGNAENDVSVTCYTPWHFMMKLDLAQFRCNFHLFHCQESFCRSFQMPSGSSFFKI